MENVLRLRFSHPFKQFATCRRTAMKFVATKNTKEKLQVREAIDALEGVTLGRLNH